ncbi:nuclear transport factor 2 family protein [Streptosporangium sp. NBC_01756]|uniref:nuclear transport factor 2 family protein n=1 Tax=Streptosporangium sp. NBC_01756 TaxID=2975950 RepID=UPI002DD88620|nr:nuclear transport factor 2 family protein [Streptosporangium sp. NBC_01756]WSC84782.1 nuclear transport factor 2 family protein [Streptosporangium sp. NBC_01756]
MSQPAAQLVRDYFELVWNQGRTELADQFLAAGLIQHNPNLPNGRQPLAEFIDGMRAQLPQARFEIRRMAADGDLVFTHSLFTAQPGHSGIAVVDVFRIADGLIAEHWDLREDVPESTVSGNPIV